ncbi:hypothetical protein ATO6_05615 [Oceanicola sp. 22II-s10i]|uniref:hypothetical protein n=1 Tax=Oceanicola sp. 22II-s10i TaxID=1317116 RepID=UPI000B521D6C|nr:hypothetical protein [Oceanicola sp. 22II-s10i]OWU86306.1 hypothetical protein ATO6_05615 [Oceanicola sp. 22II-s10i]
MAKIERMQTGLRLEKRMVKVLKGTAEYLDMSMSELVECMVLHAFDGKQVFREETRAKIAQLSEVYGFSLTSEDAHGLEEEFR